ncbi:MAG: hypothetical protein VB089_01220 [Anaerolineaceae bacterium]|nr:hypothetical protein [Anaerolineaceae bacterium]
MKKTFVILAAVLVVALGTTGFVSAQAPDPQDPTPGFGWMQGMMGAGYAGMDEMHDELVQALADQLGIPVADLEQELAGGTTLWQIAENEGWTLEQFQDWMIEAHNTALDQLVADGVLTQTQADWMNSHMNQMGVYGYGPGYCAGWDTDNTTAGGGATNWRGGMMGGRR